MLLYDQGIVVCAILTIENSWTDNPLPEKESELLEQRSLVVSKSLYLKGSNDAGIIFSSYQWTFPGLSCCWNDLLSKRFVKTLSSILFQHHR